MESCEVPSPVKHVDESRPQIRNIHIRHLAKHIVTAQRDLCIDRMMVDSGYQSHMYWERREAMSRRVGGRRGGRVKVRQRGVRKEEEMGSEIKEHMEKAKTKMLSVWNNMKYGWTLKMQESFTGDYPIWLLGKLYHCSLADLVEEDDVITTQTSLKATSITQGPSHHKSHVSSLESFKRDFTSKLWFTYRRQFPIIPGSSYTTDCGWGCMLRSAQMLLAQALTLHFLGRDWRLYNEQQAWETAYHTEIIRWFADRSSDHSPFSIHKLVSVGEMSGGKKAGDWYGPASVAHIVREAVDQAPKFNPVLANFCVYVAQDCTIYKQDVIEMCLSRSRHYSGSTSSKSYRSVLILVPVRLGGEDLNPMYLPCLEAMFSEETCCGIIGGKPKHSLYFLGWQGGKLVYLDPHFCRDVVDTESTHFSFESFHCMSPHKVSATKMDPSCTLGFYCRDLDEFEHFCSHIQTLVRPPRQRADYPMFIIIDGHANEHCWLTSATPAGGQLIGSGSLSDDSYVNLSMSDLPHTSDRVTDGSNESRNVRVYNDDHHTFVNVSLDNYVPPNVERKTSIKSKRRSSVPNDDFVFL